MPLDTNGLVKAADPKIITSNMIGIAGNNITKSDLKSIKVRTLKNFTAQCNRNDLSIDLSTVTYGYPERGFANSRMKWRSLTFAIANNFSELIIEANHF